MSPEKMIQLICRLRAAKKGDTLMPTTWKDRLAPALLAAVIGAAALAAVVSLTPEKPPFTPGQIESGVTFEALGVSADEPVMRLGENSVPAELYAFWLGRTCENLESAYGIDVADNWDMKIDGGQTLREFVREDVLELLRQQLVLENLAAEYGVDISEADAAALAERRAAYVGQYGEDGYRAELYRMGVSEAGYERLSRTDYLYSALYEAYLTPGSALYADEDVLRAYAVSEGWITADHILLMTVDPATYGPLDEEAAARKRAQAEELLARLRGSDDPAALFQELADAYGEDTGRDVYPEGYTFTHGTMVTEFDDAAHALREGELSGIVESQFGYHIILRKPLDVDEAVASVRGEYFNVIFLSAFRSAEPELCPAADKLNDEALYAALRAVQAE